MTPAKAPLSERLAASVRGQLGGEATLTCEFKAGGRLHGVGIRAPFYCQHCGGSLVWHEVAEAVAVIAAIEEGARRVRAEEEVTHAHSTNVVG